MSDKICNKCLFNIIKERALKNGKAVLKMKSKFLGGTDVFVHPSNIDITKLPGLNEADHPNRNKYFVAWFMKIPERCEC